MQLRRKVDKVFVKLVLVNLKNGSEGRNLVKSKIDSGFTMRVERIGMGVWVQVTSDHVIPKLTIRGVMFTTSFSILVN